MEPLDGVVESDGAADSATGWFKARVKLGPWVDVGKKHVKPSASIPCRCGKVRVRVTFEGTVGADVNIAVRCSECSGA